MEDSRKEMRVVSRDVIMWAFLPYKGKRTWSTLLVVRRLTMLS